MNRLPLETQTLYAEFLAQLLAVAHRRSLGQAPGCFTVKAIGGEAYYYFQYSEPGGRTRQAYIGKKTPELDRIAETFQRERAVTSEDLRAVERLCAQLRVGGALTTDAASARVLKALADAGLFQLGGVLIGTQAFVLMGNLLGIQWRRAFLQTHDLDVAALQIAMPELQADIPKVLESLQMGFLPVPSLNHRDPTTSFKVRGRTLRVDFVTPQRSPRQHRPVLISRFNVAAHPVPGLAYLLEGTQPAGVVDGGGVLVTVPNPARYALHKLALSRSRPVTEQTKAQKDLAQAAELLEVLLTDRPADLEMAWEAMDRAVPGSRKKLQSAVASLEKPFPSVWDRLRTVISALRSG